MRDFQPFFEHDFIFLQMKKKGGGKSQQLVKLKRKTQTIYSEMEFSDKVKPGRATQKFLNSCFTKSNLSNRCQFIVTWKNYTTMKLKKEAFKIKQVSN